MILPTIPSVCCRITLRNLEVRVLAYLEENADEGMVGSIIWVLLEIYLSFQQWNNFENALRIDKSYHHEFGVLLFGTQCISVCTNVCCRILVGMTQWERRTTRVCTSEHSATLRTAATGTSTGRRCRTHAVHRASRSPCLTCTRCAIWLTTTWPPTTGTRSSVDHDNIHYIDVKKTLGKIKKKLYNINNVQNLKKNNKNTYVSVLLIQCPMDHIGDNGYKKQM